MTIKKNNTLSQLILLISIFVIGIFSLISLHLVFLSFIDELNAKTQNLSSKIEIGRFIVDDITKMRSDFYELATVATNRRSRALIENNLQERIDFINRALDVLENGGILKRVIRLNVAGHNSTITGVKYNKDENDELALEVIDIRPKLVQLVNMINKVNDLIDEQTIYKNSPKEYLELSKKIKRFYRTTPAFFIRMAENASRLLYEGEIKLNDLEYEIEEQISYYEKLELMLIGVIIFIVIILGYFIARQINKNSKELLNLNTQLDIQIRKAHRQEASTRGILDAQPNIVVVSDGREMIDSNSALVEFFIGYNSFEDFKSKHACICDYFEDIGNENYIINKDYDGRKWFEYIIDNADKINKVAMYHGEELNYFTITAQKKILDEKNFIIIITLNNITSEIYAQRELENLNNNLETLVNDKTKELQELNDNLEQKIVLEVEKNRKKDQQMIQQSRFAALGEMIGNIAHQWRQPLSAISSTASAMQLQMQLNMVDNDEVEKSFGNIMKYCDFLSQTIEDFRGFFKQDKQMHEFDINDVINRSLAITNASYKDNNISIYKDTHEELFSNGFPNELSQVFLNILNNAKDALNEHLKNDDKYVKITAWSENKQNIITIHDNAGGVPEHILEKIFDPYFTTKHQSQGTGIGLFMSKEIIEKHMNGSISVENKIFELDDKTYVGASFKICLPKV